MKAPTSYTQIKDVQDFNFPEIPKDLTIVSIQETESIVQTLQPFPVEEVGCSPFLRMYAYDIERLTLQANLCAKRQDGDEYVVDAILTHKKLSILVETLLAVEAWRLFLIDGKNFKTSVLNFENSTKIEQGEDENEIDQDSSATSPLVDFIARNQSSLRCAFTLHVETTLCSLLNLIVFRSENCEELDNDTAIALVDYCARQMASLAAPLSYNDVVKRQKHPGTVEELSHRIQNRSAVEEIRDNRLDTEYKTAVVATSLARYLCEHMEFLPIGAQTRILDTHDYLQMFVSLVDEPPWTRKRISSKTDKVVWEKLHNNSEWKEVAPNNLLKVTQSEAQCWISMFHLTCSNACRQKYALNVFRKEQILRLRKYLNEVMRDQLPFLTDVMRYMDELALMDVPETSTGQGSTLLMQQVDRLRENLVRGKNWREVSTFQVKSIFSKCADGTDEDLRLIAGIYNEDLAGNLLEYSSSINLKERDEEGLSSVSMPITLATIRAEVDGKMEDVYNLTPVGNAEGGIVENNGRHFQRTKMKFNYNQDVPAGSEPFLFQKELSLEVVLSCEKFPNFKTISSSGSIGSLVENNKLQWIQMGRTKEDNYFIQLGFKMSHGRDKINSKFALRQAFVSRSVL